MRATIGIGTDFKVGIIRHIIIAKSVNKGMWIVQNTRAKIGTPAIEMSEEDIKEIIANTFVDQIIRSRPWDKYVSFS